VNLPEKAEARSHSNAKSVDNNISAGIETADAKLKG
jgi:hypothetical protein